MKKLSLTLLASVSFTASFAGGVPDSGHAPPPSASSQQGQGQDQDQGQLQGQTQGQGQSQGQVGINKSAQQQGQVGINKNANDSTASAVSANTNRIDTALKASTGSNTSTTQVGGTSYTTNSTFVQMPNVTSSQLANPVMLKETSSCGPLKQVRTTKTTATYVGLFSDTVIPMGETYDLEDLIVDGRRKYYDVHTIVDAVGQPFVTEYYGHSVVEVAAVVSGGGSRTIGGSGGNSSGFGGGAMNSNGQTQRLNVNIQLVSCKAFEVRHQANSAPTLPVPEIQVLQIDSNDVVTISKAKKPKRSTGRVCNCRKGH